MYNNALFRHLAMVYRGKINDMDLTRLDWGHTDIERLHEGHVGGQFWSIYYPCDRTQDNQILGALEAIDVTKRMINKYPKTFQFVTNTHQYQKAQKHHRIASMMGVEGGQMIDNSLAVLRQFYDLGVRYMTVNYIYTKVMILVSKKHSIVDTQLSYTLGRIMLRCQPTTL
jgi:membrane dipeptidase